MAVYLRFCADICRAFDGELYAVKTAGRYIGNIIIGNVINGVYLSRGAKWTRGTENARKDGSFSGLC